MPFPRHLVPQSTLLASSLLAGYRNYCHAKEGPGLSRSSTVGKCAPETARLLRKYNVFQELGSGAYATVYHGQQKKTKEPCAIKIIKKAHVERKILDGEVAFMKVAGKHPNIVALQETMESDKELVLIIDEVGGGELFDWLYDHGQMSESMAASCIRATAAALYHIHSNGIVHNDVKPENLLMTCSDPPTLKLADFGEAWQLKRESSGDGGVSWRGRKQNRIRGTQAYLPPEAIVRKHVCEKLDIWALGCVTYILVCGCHPFDPEANRSDAEISKCIAKGAFNVSNPIWDSDILSSDCKEVITWMLNPDPASRPTAAELLAHPWVDHSNRTPHPLPEVHRNRLRGFQALRLLQEGAAALGVRTDSLFEVCDTNGDGFIDREELGDAFGHLGQNLTREEIDRIFAEADTSSMGRLTRGEFEIALTDHSTGSRKQLTEADIAELFALLDEEGNGVVSADELIHVMHLAGARDFTNDNAEELMKKVDTNHDGQIDFEELLAFLLPYHAKK